MRNPDGSKRDAQGLQALTLSQGKGHEKASSHAIAKFKEFGRSFRPDRLKMDNDAPDTPRGGWDDDEEMAKPLLTEEEKAKEEDDKEWEELQVREETSGFNSRWDSLRYLHCTAMLVASRGPSPGQASNTYSSTTLTHGILTPHSSASMLPPS
jgi:hypothetical protein